MKKHKLSTLKMLKQMRKNVGEVYEAENGYYRVCMNPLISGGSIVRLRELDSLDKKIKLKKPIPKQVTFENQNPYEYVEVLTISNNLLRNWKWRKLDKSEYEIYIE